MSQHPFDPIPCRGNLTVSMLMVVLSCIMFWGQPALASEVTDIEVDGNELRATVDLAGLYSAQLTITFEQVVGLDPDAFDISASLLDPLSSLSLLQRLPDPEEVGLSSLFPVLLQIAPSAGSKLSFSGVVQIEVSTSHLTYSPLLRLFKASDRALFHDITNLSGTGSYRVRGASGRFSEFLIVTDLRNANGVAELKFQALAKLLDDNAEEIEDSLLSQLESKLDTARSLFRDGSRTAAIDEIKDFIALVEDNQGTGIPSVYRANDPDSNNVAGDLRAQAATLIFSIKLI